MGFKIGSKVTPIKKSSWSTTEECNESPVPKHGVVYTVNSTSVDGAYQYIGLSEMPQIDEYRSDAFRKVEPKSAKNEISAKLAKKHLEESEIIKEVDTIDKPNPVHA